MQRKPSFNMKEKNNWYEWFTKGLKDSGLLLAFVISLVGYLMFRKKNKKKSYSNSTALKPYDPDSQIFMKQFEKDIKKNGFVVVWKEDGVAYMEDISQGFAFISHAELNIIGELAIYRNKSKDVIVIKPDKTYEIQTQSAHRSGELHRMIEMYCRGFKIMQEIEDIVARKSSQIRGEFDEIRRMQQQNRASLDKRQSELDEILAHIGLPKRSNSFTEMIKNNSEEKQGIGL